MELFEALAQNPDLILVDGDPDHLLVFIIAADKDVILLLVRVEDAGILRDVVGDAGAFTLLQRKRIGKCIDEVSDSAINQAAASTDHVSGELLEGEFPGGVGVETPLPAVLAVVGHGEEHQGPGRGWRGHRGDLLHLVALGHVEELLHRDPRHPADHTRTRTVSGLWLKTESGISQSLPASFLVYT